MFPVTNVVVAGLGGQGVLCGTDILAAVALGASYDVKKSEVKGMSQRGGSVTGEVRFGERVLSPMVPSGEADFLLALEPTQVEPNRHLLRANGVLITPEAVLIGTLPHKRTMNVALLGALSAHLPLAPELWLESLRTNFEAGFFEANQNAFELGRQSQAHARESIGHGPKSIEQCLANDKFARHNDLELVSLSSALTRWM